MTIDNTIALYASALERGALSPMQQVMMASSLNEFIIEFRAMKTTLDEIYQNEREQDEIDRRQEQLDRAVQAGAVPGVVPMCRPVWPVRWVAPAIVAVEP